MNDIKFKLDLIFAFLLIVHSHQLWGSKSTANSIVGFALSIFAFVVIIHAAVVY